MINQNIQMKINEVTEQLNELRAVPRADVEARRNAVKEIVGDAEVYLENLLVWLRNL